MQSVEQPPQILIQRWGDFGSPLHNTSASSFLKASATTREKGLIQRNPETAHGVSLKDLNRLARHVNYTAPTSAGDQEVHNHTIDFPSATDEQCDQFV